MKALRELEGKPERHEATMFLSRHLPSRESGDEDALRDTLDRMREGFASGAILGGRLLDIEVEEEDVFMERKPLRLVLVAVLAFSV